MPAIAGQDSALNGVFFRELSDFDSRSERSVSVSSKKSEEPLQLEEQAKLFSLMQ